MAEKNMQEKLNELKEIRKQIYNNNKDQGVMTYNKVEFLGKGEKTGKELYRVIEEYSLGEDKTERRAFFYEFENDSFDLIVFKRGDDIFPTEDYLKEGKIVDGKWESSIHDDIVRCVEERDNELRAIAKELRISEDEISNLGKIDLEQKIDNKGKENKDEKEPEHNENEAQKISEEKLKKSGQIGLNEVNLNAQVDGKGTRLKDILKLDGYTKIMVVHSYKLPELTNSEGKRGKNSIEKYSLIAQKSDGTYETIPQLEPDRGGNKEITEINDKDDVETKKVDNRFKIPGSDYSFVIDPKDPYNIPNIYLSRNTPDNDGQLAQRIQDKYDGTESTDIEVRAIFNAYRGKYMTKEAVKEAREHPTECEKGVEEVDGDKNTGHVHFNPQDIEQQNAIEDIMTKGRVSEDEAKYLFVKYLENKNNGKEGQERIKYAKEEAISEIEGQYIGMDKRGQ